MTVDFPNPTIQQSNNPTIIEIPLRNFRPWSPEHPNLYLAETPLANGARKYTVSGLDVLSDTAEGTAILDGILARIADAAIHPL